MKKQKLRWLALLGAALASLTLVGCENESTTEENATYTVTVAQTEHGTVTASPTTAQAGAKITLTATADEGYALDTISATDATNAALTMSESAGAYTFTMSESAGAYTFTMPESNVTVRATFKESDGTETTSAVISDGTYTIGGTEYTLSDGKVTVEENGTTREVGTVNADGSVTITTTGADGSETTIKIAESSTAGEVTLTVETKDSEGNESETVYTGDIESGSLTSESGESLSVTVTPADEPDTPTVTTYTVTFNTDGGTAVAAQSVESGKKATAPTSPTKDGYVFNGWYSDSGLTNAFDFATAITADTTLYAKWELLPPNSHTVTFDSDGGSTVETQTVTEGSTATEPAAPTKTGCTFAGWYKGEITYDFDTAVTANITLTAHWTAIDYTIIYELNGGSWAADYTATASYTVEDEISLPDAEKVTRTGYGFGGWYETAELTGDAVSQIANGTTGNKTFYAKWTAGTVNYTVKHYQQNLSDDDYTLFESETKSGTTGAQTEAAAKTYAGFTAPESVTQAAIAADGTTEVEIRYTRNTYTVTFDADGGSEVDSQTVKYSGTATTPTAPTKTGYTFAGWYNGNAAYDFDTTVTANITLTAQWTAAGAETKSRPDAVGDVVLSDGTAVSATNASEMSAEQKAKAVAVIFYAGSASDLLGAKTLGVGLKNTQGETTTTLAWAESTANGYSTNITAIQCIPSESGSGKAAAATFTGDTDGSDNWAALCDAVNDEDTSGNYPAWEWVNAYATTNSLTGDWASGWYLPTIAELSALYRVKDTVNASLESAGGMKIADTAYWSSSQDSSIGLIAWDVWFDVGSLSTSFKGYGRSVCCIRAF